MEAVLTVTPCQEAQDLHKTASPKDRICYCVQQPDLIALDLRLYINVYVFFTSLSELGNMRQKCAFQIPSVHDMIYIYMLCMRIYKINRDKMSASRRRKARIRKTKRERWQRVVSWFFVENPVDHPCFLDFGSYCAPARPKRRRNLQNRLADLQLQAHPLPRWSHVT